MFLCTNQGRLKVFFAQIKEGFVFLIANQGGFNPFFVRSRKV